MSDLESAKRLSPLRKSSQATDLQELANEQLEHFSIDSKSPLGKSLGRLVGSLYTSQIELNSLWGQSLELLQSLDKSERISFFNAKFLQIIA